MTKRDILSQFIAEATSDRFTFRVGETVTNVKPIRVIPRPEGYYFGGEVGGYRGRGSTAATFPPGTDFEVVERIGGSKAKVTHPDLDKPMVVHKNQFSQTHAEKYAASKERGRVANRQVQQAPQEELSPEDELAAAEQAFEADKVAFIKAKKRLKIAQLMMQDDDDFDLEL